MNLKKLLLAFVAIASCSVAMAASPSDKSVNKWIEVQHIERDFIKDVINASKLEYKRQIAPHIASYPPELQPQMQAALDRYANKVFAAYFTPQRRDKWFKEIKEIAKNEFTQQEIDAMIAFYETPAGQSILEKNLEFFIKVTNVITNETTMKELEEITNYHLPEFQKEVEKIMLEECTP